MKWWATLAAMVRLGLAILLMVAASVLFFMTAATTCFGVAPSIPGGEFLGAVGTFVWSVVAVGLFVVGTKLWPKNIPEEVIAPVNADGTRTCPGCGTGVQASAEFCGACGRAQ